MATSSKHNSRFSTLKVFKFSAGSKPPPLPPKDPYYLPNPSLRSLGNSLSPDSLPSSQPPTPLSAQYATIVRSPSPTPSYAPSRITVSPPYESTSKPVESASSRKSLFKFSSLSRRPKTQTPKAADSGHSAGSESLVPPEPVDDPSISLPWNFQHNIHVDEGFVGLPPTWSASLAGAGFSEEEIAALQAKRAESRSRSTRSIYSLNLARSASPAGTTRTPTYGAPTRRDQSDASLSQVSLASSHRPYGSRSHIRKVSTSSHAPSEHSSSTHPESEPRRTPPMTRPTPKHSFTYPQLQSQSTPHLPTHRSSASITRLAPPLPPPPAISVVSDNSSGSGASEKQLMARNAPSRSYHIANESIATIEHSPPPAYMSPRKESHISNVQTDENFRLPPSIVESEPGLSNEAGRSSTNSSSSGSHGATTTTPVLPTPPRLSFHQDDLSSWTASLFSSIPDSVTLTPPKPTVPRPQPSSSRLGADSGASRSRAGSIRTRDRSPSATVRQLPPQKPIPKQEPPPTIALPLPPQPPSPLWDEVMNLVKAGEEASSLTSTSYLQDTSADYSTDSYSTLLTPLTPVLDEFPPIPHINDPDQLDFRGVLGREKENRDSGLSTMTVTPATIATAAIARSVRPNMVTSPVRSNEESTSRAVLGSREPDDDRSCSPNSSESHSSASSSSTTASLSTGTGSASSDSRPLTLTTEASEWRSSGAKPKSLVYSDPSPEPSPRASTFGERDAFTVSVTADLRESEADVIAQHRPSIVTEDNFLSTRRTDSNLLTPISSSSSSPSPLSPTPRYPGWLSEVVAPLKSFINDQVDPRDLYADLREIAEGESGSVYAARVLGTPASPEKEPDSHVAIKNIAIMPTGSPKINDLQRELTLMKAVSHPHILTMDALYVDLVEDSLWIRMELMERSVADVIALVEDGIDLNERLMAQVASDVLDALVYLQSRGIAHRDVRSDNLLVNRDGIVKLADFSSAIQVSPSNATCSEPAGVIYWQAPEIRRGSYNALKVDVWSLGATIWELAETEPPFSGVTDPRQLGTELPPLRQPEIYSRSLHDFLNLCSSPSSSRPDPHDLQNISFIRNPGGRQAIVNMLAECRDIERLSRRQSTDSAGTVSRS